MITILNDVPENVIGLRATGEVGKEGYKRVVVPAIDNHAKQYGKGRVNILTNAKSLHIVPNRIEIIQHMIR